MEPKAKSLQLVLIFTELLTPLIKVGEYVLSIISSDRTSIREKLFHEGDEFRNLYREWCLLDR